MNAELVADDGNIYRLVSSNVNIKEIKMDETDIKKIENGEVVSFIARRN